MPNVGEKSFPDKRMELHDASLDALVRASAPAPPYQPYPGDHPCEIKGCTANAPFGLAALPRRVWFCREHLEEIRCLTQPRQPTQSKFSPPSVGREGVSGERDTSPTSPEQLTLWKAGPSTTD
jgi:hypothetical protein